MRKHTQCRNDFSVIHTFGTQYSDNRVLAVAYRQRTEHNARVRKSGNLVFVANIYFESAVIFCLRIVFPGVLVKIFGFAAVKHFLYGILSFFNKIKYSAHSVYVGKFRIGQQI